MTSASPKYLTGKKLMTIMGMKQIEIQIAAFNGDQYEMISAAADSSAATEMA